MALPDTARLIASLELQDKFSATASKYEKTLGSMERKTSTLEKVGFQVGRGARNTIDNIGKIAIIGGGIVASQVALGVKSLAQLEEIKNQTDAVLESTGGVANVTAEQIRTMAESLEDLTTIDDKAIQAGQNMLLTFTNIRNEVGEGNDIFNQATDAILDLSVAMGTDPKQAALQLGKALNDPVRGLTALRRVGIQFTEQQEDQIEKMVEAGDVMGAQKVILAELNTEFGKSAEAFGEGPAADMRRFGDAIEGAQQALATGFLPVITKVSRLVQDTLGDPQVQAGIKSFGTSLAGGVEDLIDIATKLPWEAIGSSAKLMGQGAKALLDAFTSLPPWIQTAVLTGWGLNKLTGGALGNIAGILTKSVFGALRGSTPATPVFTKEVGVGGTGGTPVAGRAGSVLSNVGKFVLGPAASVIIGAEIAAAINESTIRPAANFEEEQFRAVLDSKDANRLVAGLSAIERAQRDPDLFHQVALIGSNIPFISDALGNVGPKLEQQRQELIAQLKEQGYTNEQIAAMVAKLDSLREQSSAFASSATSRWSNEQREAYAQLQATRTGDARLGQALSVVNRNLADGNARQREIAQRVSEARDRIGSGFQRSNDQLGIIARKDFSANVKVNVPVTTQVSINDVIRSVTHASFASQVTNHAPGAGFNP